MAVPESMQPADIRPHPTSYHQWDEHLQVTYLFNFTAQAFKMSRFEIHIL